jgi:hypothetical protein
MPTAQVDFFRDEKSCGSIFRELKKKDEGYVARCDAAAVVVGYRHTIRQNLIM